MSMQYILLSVTNAIATISLNRPEKRNALHQPMIVEIISTLKNLAQDNSRVLIIKGNGENFCAGGDIGWMQKIAQATSDENDKDAQYFADLFYALYHFPKPIIVLVNGAVLGGGVGLVATADIAIAAKSANFCFSEVKIGLIPSVISPYVIAAIGSRMTSYYFLTAEKFTAEQAQRMHLVHQIVEEDALMSVGVSIAQQLMQNSPQALKACKELVREVNNKEISSHLAKKTAAHLANIRVSSEAQEGLQAFLDKRLPKWREETG